MTASGRLETFWRRESGQRKAVRMTSEYPFVRVWTVKLLTAPRNARKREGGLQEWGAEDSKVVRETAFNRGNVPLEILTT